MEMGESSVAWLPGGLVAWWSGGPVAWWSGGLVVWWLTNGQSVPCDDAQLRVSHLFQALSSLPSFMHVTKKEKPSKKNSLFFPFRPKNDLLVYNLLSFSF